MVNLLADTENMYRVKHDYRHGLRTPIVVVNSLADLNKLHCKKVSELDFWNDICGFFHQNSDHPVYDITNGDVEIPADIPVRRTWDGEHGSLTSPIVAGTCIIDKDYNVYICYGWDNSSGGSVIFFDFI